MALNPPSPPSLRFPLRSPPPSAAAHHLLLFSDLVACSRLLHCPPWPQLQLQLVPRKRKAGPSRAECVAGSAEEGRWIDSETLVSDGDGDGRVPGEDRSSRRRTATASSSSDYFSIGIREPVYEVVEVKSNGMISTRKINRRQLLKSSGLRPRDIRSVDPSLWLINSMPSLLVREYAILLNLGSLRAIVMPERVFIFNYDSRGGKAFIELLLPRLNPNVDGGHCMPFELEVVEAALISRIQRYEQRLMNLEPRVLSLLEVLPNRLTADILEELRLSKQALVELGSRAGALKQMLLDLLEDPHEIRRICIMGRNCTITKGNDALECSVPLEKQIAEEEEEEIEMLLENYLQRCESCHGQAERLLDSAKEMEDSIAVNLSSRRLEVSRVELLLQVGAFCVAVGALVAVRILADNCWNYFWCCCGFLPYVCISQGKENTVIRMPILGRMEVELEMLSFVCYERTHKPCKKHRGRSLLEQSDPSTLELACALQNAYL